jgi:hypothetical protein
MNKALSPLNREPLCGVTPITPSPRHSVTASLCALRVTGVMERDSQEFESDGVTAVTVHRGWRTVGARLAARGVVGRDDAINHLLESLAICRHQPSHPHTHLFKKDFGLHEG